MLPAFQKARTVKNDTVEYFQENKEFVQDVGKIGDELRIRIKWKKLNKKELLKKRE